MSHDYIKLWKFASERLLN